MKQDDFIKALLDRCFDVTLVRDAILYERRVGDSDIRVWVFSDTATVEARKINRVNPSCVMELLFAKALTLLDALIEVLK